LFIPPGIYKLASRVNVPDGVSIFGAGKWATILFCPTAFSDTNGLIAVSGVNGYPTSIRSLAIVAQTGGAGGCGLVSTKNGFFISDIWINGFVTNYGMILNQTDNYLSDFVIEMCLNGLLCQQTHQTISDGELFYNQAVGGTIANSGSVENGRVTFTNVRCAVDAQVGFLVSGGKRVTLDACAVTHVDGSRYTTAGIKVDSSNDVIVTGYSSYLGTFSSAAAAVLISNSTNVQVGTSNGGNWRDGVRAINSVAVTVDSSNFSGNSRYGIYVSGGDQIILTGNNCHSNGVTGIFSDNVSASGNHLINSNMTNNHASYGITANVGAASAFTNIVGNMARGNSAGGVQKSGLVTNINDVANY